MQGGGVTWRFLFCYGDILPKTNSFVSGTVAEDNFNKSYLYSWPVYCKGLISNDVVPGR